MMVAVLAAVSAFAAETKLPDPVAYAQDWGRRAAECTRREDLKGALATLDRALAEMPGGEGWKKRAEEALDDERAEVYTAFYRFREAFDYLVSKGRLLAALCYFDRNLIGDLTVMSRLCHRVLDDPSSSWNARARAWNWLYTRESEYADRHFPLGPSATSAQTNAVVRMLAGKLREGRIWGLEGTTTPVAYFFDRKQTLRAWATYRALQSALGQAPDFRCRQSALVAFAGEGDRKAAASVAREGLADEGLKPEERYELELAVRVLEMSGTADEIAAEVARVEPPLAKGLKDDVRLARLERVGAIALYLCDEALTRGVAQYRAKVKPQLPKKEYVVRYSERPVRGVDSWDKLPFAPEKSPFDRKYGGGGASFLVTDVSTGDRGNAVKSDDGASSVDLEIVADVWGLHILRTFHDRRAREFESGFLDAGSFEEYIAPGENQPYTCFMTYPKRGAQRGGFDTSYDSPGHRRIDRKDSSRFVHDVAFTDEAIRVYTGLAWENFATLVPTKDSAWDFESVFWGPVECAWNGTESIHGRSTWGRLRFDLPEEARIRILRALVCKAAGDYKAEKTARHGWEGAILHWQDDVVGDPAFYDACIKPLVEELDAAAARVKPEMSDDDVRDLAENYLAKWRDLRFTIGRLRSEYLTEKL